MVEMRSLLKKILYKSHIFASITVAMHLVCLPQFAQAAKASNTQSVCLNTKKDWMREKLYFQNKKSLFVPKKDIIRFRSIHTYTRLQKYLNDLQTCDKNVIDKDAVFNVLDQDFQQKNVEDQAMELLNFILKSRNAQFQYTTGTQNLKKAAHLFANLLAQENTKRNTFFLSHSIHGKTVHSLGGYKGPRKIIESISGLIFTSTDKSSEKYKTQILAQILHLIGTDVSLNIGQSQGHFKHILGYYNPENKTKIPLVVTIKSFNFKKESQYYRYGIVTLTTDLR